jgi:hypothetical protein
MALNGMRYPGYTHYARLNHLLWGWTVRVHERAQEVRDGGTGLYIKNNAAEVLEEFGVFDRLLPHGSRLECARRIDWAGRVMQERSLAGQARVHVFIRKKLVEALRDVDRLPKWVKTSRQTMSALTTAFAESGHGGPIPNIGPNG